MGEMGLSGWRNADFHQMDWWGLSYLFKQKESSR